jgi:hypothetical protein
MTPALHDTQADAAWFWEREAHYAGRAAFERNAGNEHAARRLDFMSAANRACAIKADDQASSIRRAQDLVNIVLEAAE